MIKFTIDDKSKFSMTSYNTHDFNLEVYASVSARREKEMYELEGIKVNLDSIYNNIIKRFKSYMSMEVFFI